MSQSKQIYFHVGLGKTGTTYLQYDVFPKFKGIHYIQRTKYRNDKYVNIIKKTNHNKYLVSNEFDRQLETETTKIAAHYPDARPIIVLRQHDGWMASQYRRQVKNGRSLLFNEFLDLSKDTGDWKINDVYYYPKLLTLEKNFNHKPFVLFYDDFKKDAHKFFNRLASYIGATYNQEDINLNPRHRSYNEKQLKCIRYVSRHVFRQQTNYSDQYYLRKIQKQSRMLARYMVLYSSLLIPDSWLDDEPLIPPSDLEKVRVFYESDWQKCLKYAKENNASLEQDIRK
ncbi:MAG: hypothetical protein GF313_00020 [Caldithrix sp.]|nr:hypothetical protein [Caldithrix sp.]